VDDIRELAQYAPHQIEQKWYAAWEEAGLFAPRRSSGDGEPFVITLPPPNVTGILHMGHCLGNSIQDTLIRWARMCGRETLWLDPGHLDSLGAHVRTRDPLGTRYRPREHRDRTGGFSPTSRRGAG